MTEYAAQFHCIDSVVDFTDEVDPSVQIALDADSDLTESKVFLNVGRGTTHSALDLLGMWYATHKFPDVHALGAALFAPGSENDFTIFRISRPKGPGDKGFVEFEVDLDVKDPWSVRTTSGLKEARRIRLAFHLALSPVQ